MLLLPLAVAGCGDDVQAKLDRCKDDIRAELTATIYLSPKSQGVTAGATPQGPTTGTPADGTTPAESTPAAAPAATATP